MKTVDDINADNVELRNNNKSVKEVSDKYHTFGDYVDMRNHLFAALCNAYKDKAWKSRKHYDEENDPMFNGDFIAGIDTPKGPVTFHLKLKFWDLVKVKELDRAPKYDGYTEEDVKERLNSLGD